MGSSAVARCRFKRRGGAEGKVFAGRLNLALRSGVKKVAGVYKEALEPKQTGKKKRGKYGKNKEGTKIKEGVEEKETNQK